jgi:site-specific DNA-methyltransferase (adenine-specific)
MGSGTTGVACKNLNRNFIGFDIVEKYVKISNDRLDNVDAYGQTSMFLK